MLRRFGERLMPVGFRAFVERVVNSLEQLVASSASEE
jgi:hypothetical protein